MSASEIGEVVGMFCFLLLLAATVVFGVAMAIKEANRRDTMRRSQPPPPPPRLEWEVRVETEVEDLVRHSELTKRMNEKYATALEDEELARTMKRVLERERMRLLDPSSKA